MTRKWHFREMAGGLLLLMAAQAVRAGEQVVRNPLAVGEVVSLHSAVLSEERTIQVCLPADYEGSSCSYPVLYVLDGGRNFLHAAGSARLLAELRFIPGLIVVAVLNTNRERDFATASVAGYPEVAGASSFLAFLEKELIPFVDREYRTTPFRILFGHSLSGLFAAFALGHGPGLFAAHILTCPSLTWDGGKALADVAAFFRDQRQARGFVYLAVTDEDDRPTIKACAEFGRLLKKRAPPALRWRYEVVRGESHGSVAQPVIFQALKAIYDGWRILNSRLARMSLAQVRGHYRRLAQEFGDVRAAQEVSLSELGYLLLERREYRQAIEAFRANVDSSPNSEYRNSELGYAYERAGDLAAAVHYYGIAVRVARAAGAQELPGYEADLRRAQKKLDEASAAKQ